MSKRKNAAASTDKRNAMREARMRKQAETLAEYERKKRLELARKAEREHIKREREKARLERDAVKQREYEARAALRAERLKARKRFYAKLKGKLENNRYGFDYSSYGFLPRVELEADGDMTSVAAKLAAGGVTVSDMRRKDGKTRFKIRKKDLRKGIAILNQMCYNYRIGATYGIVRKCLFMLARAGLFVGIAASIACLYISYGYVWRVDVSGNDKLSVAAIESALSGAGYGSGCKKRDIDTDRIVATLGDMDGVADASCEIVGTTLYVRVLESKDYTVHGKCTSYTAGYDAKVTRIVMRSGTASVKRGDVVKRGDTLASGDVYSTTGELLYTAECDAEIYGDVSLTYSVDVSNTAVEYVRTGRTKTQTVFSLFGMRLGKPKSPFASYETTAHTANYDVLLPLYATTYEFYETEPRETERDIDDIAKAFAASKLEETEFIGEFECSYKIAPTAAGLYSIHLFLSGETLISRGVTTVSQT